MPNAGKREGPVHPSGNEAGHDPPDLARYRQTLQAYMETKGLRSTDQRRLIVETFFRAPNHVSIEELLAQVRHEDPKVGYATVYRTLKLLAESGIAYEREFGDGLTRYELADGQAQIERLQDKIAASYGFQLRSHKHELYGICPICRAADAAKA